MIEIGVGIFLNEYVILLMLMYGVLACVANMVDDTENMVIRYLSAVFLPWIYGIYFYYSHLFMYGIPPSVF